MIFIVRYAREKMLLKGHIEQWISIMDMNGASLFKAPKDVLLTMARIAQENLMFVLHKSYYVRAGWDTRTFYKAFSWALDPVTRAKIAIEGAADPPELRQMYHPSQLERRFGGEVDTPTNYWPPYVGEKFFPNDDTSHLDLMDEETYLKVLEQNPELPRRPDLIFNASQNTRDFRYEESSIHVVDPTKRTNSGEFLDV